MTISPELARAVKQQLADTLAESARLAATGGPEAVGRAAYYDGHPLGSPTAIADRYRGLQDEARRQAQAA